jgi:hypothetical protein
MSRAAWLDVLSRLPSVFVTAAPACLLALLVAGSAIVIGSQGFWYLAVADGLIGFAAGAHWATRHAYDLPLVIVFDAGNRDATDAGTRLAELEQEWTVRLVTLLSLPLVAVGVLCVGIGMLLAPLAAAAVFLLALTVWLPFAALVLIAACQHLIDAHGAPAHGRARATP